jgi:hypothetical protein
MTTMTLDEARAHIGDSVLYREGTSHAELGVIASVNESYVFVRYQSEHAVVIVGSQATSPEDLTLITPEQARRFRFRAGLRTGGGDD